MNQKVIPKKYWSGNIRLLSDFFWSSVIAVFFRVTEGYRLGIEAAPLYFFLFFFWSWNEQHVKKRFAKWFIHILSWMIIAFAFLTLIIGFFARLPSTNFADWLAATIILVLGMGIAIKYKSVMWPKKHQQREAGEVESEAASEKEIPCCSTKERDTSDQLS